ncbi:YqzG/YhdC family protein [Virgibacillus sp. JSM 102003]|uniref:YqzG/YhdC family protein n=1 Tax=Virgibacillus sp. JSM 102003 TaxID=1562108 RepID=UPI0035BF9906
MRLLLISFSVFLLLSPTNLGAYPLQQIAVAEKDIPSYAKWGRMAMKETKAKYPNAAIIDYLHRGRETKDGSTIEKFKLWLKEDNREFGVFINIEFNTETEKVIDITFRESSS